MVYDFLGKCNANEVDQVKEWLSLWTSYVQKEIDAILSVSCFKCSWLLSYINLALGTVPKQSNGNDYDMFICMFSCDITSCGNELIFWYTLHDKLCLLRW